MRLIILKCEAGTSMSAVVQAQEATAALKADRMMAVFDAKNVALARVYGGPGSSPGKAISCNSSAGGINSVVPTSHSATAVLVVFLHRGPSQCFGPDPNHAMGRVERSAAGSTPIGPARCTDNPAVENPWPALLLSLQRLAQQPWLTHFQPSWRTGTAEHSLFGFLCAIPGTANYCRVCSIAWLCAPSGPARGTAVTMCSCDTDDPTK